MRAGVIAELTPPALEHAEDADGHGLTLARAARRDGGGIHAHSMSSHGDIRRQTAGLLVSNNGHLETVGETRELTNPTQPAKKRLSGHPPLGGVLHPVRASVAKTLAASGRRTLCEKT
jgi:hypothetical protein